MSVPALWLLVVAFWAGCLVSGPWWLALPAPSAVWLVARRMPGPRTRVALLACALALAGCGLAGGRAALLERGPLAYLAAEGAVGELTGTVVSEPRQSPAGAWGLVRIDQVDGQAARARALLRSEDIDKAPELGERIAVRARARMLETDGFEGYLRRLHAGTALEPVGRVERIAPAGPVIGLTNRIRERVRDASRRHLGAEEAALLAGLVTGDTRGQSWDREEQLQAAGLSHLVAVSGSNVALVLAGTLGVAGALGLGARGRRVLGLAAVVWFALLVRGEPSVLRASVMAALVLIAGLRGRGSDPRHVLGAAALLLLLVDPLLAGQLGFALSVGATAGVLVLAPPLAARLPGPRPLRLLLAASAGAHLGVAPVLLALPDGLPLASLPANLIAVPAAALASVIGIVVALLAQISVAAGGVVAVLAWPALRVVLLAGEVFASGPRLDRSVLFTPVAALLLLAVLLRRRSPRLAVVAMALAAGSALLPVLLPTPTVTSVTLTALDVGQGDALLVESPGVPGGPTARLLVDGGPDPGGALQALRERRIRALDAVALTHSHADHSGGLPAVLAALDVGVLLVGPRPLDPMVAPSTAETYATARRLGIPVQPVAAGSRFPLGAAIVDVLNPPPDRVLGEANDESLVLRIDGGSGVALLAGDAEEAAQRFMLRTPERLRADVLKVPHHGGDTNSPGFFAAVGATTAVISAGEDNDYGHPHARVLADLTEATVWRTDLHGGVSLTVDHTAAHARAPPGAAVHRARGARTAGNTVERIVPQGGVATPTPTINAKNGVPRQVASCDVEFVRSA
ncbi:MAG: DUF4131 domain-containing protein [Nitriliruptorales bacterium]|nr:DUF4131 domain-containing protein [Nitriliruptorales bacterium]